MPTLQNIRTDNGTYTGDAAGLSALGDKSIYNVPITGGFYSGAASGYPGALTKSNAPLDSGAVTSSSGTSRQDESTLGTNITTMSNPAYVAPTSNTQYIDDYQAKLDARRAAEMDQINTQFDQQAKSLEGQNNAETGSTSAALARAGGYLGVSGSSTGVLQNLAETHKNDMLALESKRQAALSAARNAYEDKDFALAQAKAADAKDIEQTAYTRQQAYFKQISDATTAAQPQKDQVSIYNAIQDGAKSPDDIFKALNGTVPIEDINAFLTKSTPASTGGYSFTPTDTAKLLGAGFSTKDITAIHDYVNTNGYTDDLRKTLTSSERTILDSIYYPKVAGPNSVGGSLTISEAKSLGLPVSLIGKSQAQVFTELQGVTPPSWFIEYAQNKMQANIIPEELQRQWDDFRNGIIGTFAGGSAGASSNSSSSSSSSPSSSDAYAGF